MSLEQIYTILNEADGVQWDSDEDIWDLASEIQSSYNVQWRPSDEP